MEELLKMIEKFAEQEVKETEEKIRDYDSKHETGGKSKWYHSMCGYVEGIKAMREAVEEWCVLNDIEVPEVAE